jgi:hypothetical protein
MTLQELRQARKLTQVRMPKVLGITQNGVSRRISRPGAGRAVRDCRSGVGPYAGRPQTRSRRRIIRAAWAQSVDLGSSVNIRACRSG